MSSFRYVNNQSNVSFPNPVDEKIASTEKSTVLDDKEEKIETVDLDAVFASEAGFQVDREDLLSVQKIQEPSSSEIELL